MFVLVHVEPLTVEKRMADTGYAPVQQKTRNNSRLVIISTVGDCDFFFTTPETCPRSLNQSILFIHSKDSFKFRKAKIFSRTFVD